MLADSADTGIPCGALTPSLYRRAEFLYQLIEFIAHELPKWRDDPVRPAETSETILTEQLCDFLNDAARKSVGWDVLQFRTEVADNVRRSRKLDLAAKPCETTIYIDGKRHTLYDALLPIECKRLPTPSGTNRDPREYVFSRFSNVGGIQRYKTGEHGSDRSLAAMIAYVQGGTLASWRKRIASWIHGLERTGEPGWTRADILDLIKNYRKMRCTEMRSSHARDGTCSIEIRHLWIMMN